MEIARCASVSKMINGKLSVKPFWLEVLTFVRDQDIRTKSGRIIRSTSLQRAEAYFQYYPVSSALLRHLSAIFVIKMPWRMFGLAQTITFANENMI